MIKNVDVLYVEDNLINARLMQTFFAQQNWPLTLRIAQSAKAGLEMIQNQQPNIILMDINLPDMTGDEAIVLIKDNPTTKHIPVIAITALAMHDEVENFEMLFDSCVTKPVDFIELKKVLTRFSN